MNKIYYIITYQVNQSTKLYLRRDKLDIKFVENINDASLYKTYREAIRKRREMFSDSLKFKVETYNRHEGVVHS